MCADCIERLTPDPHPQLVKTSESFCCLINSGINRFDPAIAPEHPVTPDIFKAGCLKQGQEEIEANGEAFFTDLAGFVAQGLLADKENRT